VHRPTEMTHVVKWAEPGGRIWNKSQGIAF
jgi:hypothetical protein